MSALHRLVRSRLEVMLGPMWSGKTDLLLNRLEAARPYYAGVVTIKHSADTRHPGLIAARTGLRLDADLSTSDLSAVGPVRDHTLYAIDEAQFFGDSLPLFTDAVLAARGTALLVAGLNLDYARNPFGRVADVALEAVRRNDIPVAVWRLAARCSAVSAGTGAPCGAAAAYTQRLKNAGGGGRVLVGDAEYYRPACALHHSPHPVSDALWGPAATATAAAEVA